MNFWLARPICTLSGWIKLVNDKIKRANRQAKARH